LAEQNVTPFVAKPSRMIAGPECLHRGALLNGALEAVKVCSEPSGSFDHKPLVL